jgi:hypothetical protein
MARRWKNSGSFGPLAHRLNGTQTEGDAGHSAALHNEAGDPVEIRMGLLHVGAVALGSANAEIRSAIGTKVLAQDWARRGGCSGADS